MQTHRTTAIAAALSFIVMWAAHAETNLVITSFEHNGQLTWSNVNPNLHYRLEWANTLVNSNSWQIDYTPLIDVSSTDSTITVGVPRFYRVVGGSQLLIPNASNVVAGTIVQGVNGTFWKGNRFDYGNDTTTIVDYKTSLMWTRSLDWAWTNWNGAVSLCDTLDYAGYTDWRLPTKEELEGIIGTGSFPNDNLDGDKPPFTDEESNYYWSSSAGSTTAWRVRYGTSSSHLDDKTAGNRVWPVRIR
jgi:hypothetical protein